jgi:hypothetical protein
VGCLKGWDYKIGPCERLFISEAMIFFPPDLPFDAVVTE